MSQITITEDLDPNADERLFRLGTIQLGDITITPPADSAFFTTEVDLRATKGIIVRVTAGVDVENRRAVWIISALDPDTGELVDDPRFGLLPPGGNPADEQGVVSYSIEATSTSQTGDRIDAAATITFDNRPAMETRPIFNTLDATAPTTDLTVAQPDASVPIYNLSWTAEDESGGSGVQDTTIYVSENGGPFAAWLSNSTANSAVYVGQAGSTYRFAAQSRDHVGNVEFVADLFATSTVTSTSSTSQSQTSSVPVTDTETIGTTQTGVPSNPSALEQIGVLQFPFSFVDPDFSAQTFASGFAESGAGIGPQGIAFLPDGDVLISNGADRNSLYRLSAAGGQVGTPLAIETEFPIYDLAVDSQGRVWATTGGGPLVQLDPANGNILGRYGPDGARGLAIDPLTGNVYYSSNEGIMILDPYTGKIRQFSTLRVDGMAFTTDGTLWTLSWPDRGELIKWDRRGPHQVVLALGGGAEGLAAGLPGSPFAGKLIVNNNDGSVSLIDPDALEVTTLASGGTRGSFAATGPDGAVYVTQSDQVVVFEGFQVAPKVVFSSPSDGSALTVAPSVALIGFSLGMLADSPTDPSSVTNPNNYVLVGSRSGPIPVIGADYNPQTRVVTLTFASLPSDRYVLLVRPEVQSVANQEMEAPFTAIFTVAVAPQVVSTSPADGQLVPPGLTQASVVFSIPMLAGQVTEAGSVLNPENYHLLGQNSGPVDITSVTYDTTSHTATLHFDTLPADFYTLIVETSVQSADGVAIAAPFQSRFTQLADVTGDFRIDYSSLRTNRTDGTEIADVTLTNTSTLAEQDKLLLVLRNLQPADVSLANQSGLTADGQPYLDLPMTYGGDGLFSPGESLAMGSLTYSNPDSSRIDFQSQLLAYPTVRNQLPVITSPPITMATIGQTYAYPVVATDQDHDHLLYSLQAGPAGMVIDNEGGEILWNPQPGTPAQVSVKVRVYEEPLGDFTTQEFTITVTDRNQPPILEPIGNRRTSPGQNVSFALAGSDPEGASVTYFASNLPAGATFDPSSAQFSWTPTTQQTGVYLDLLFGVSDGTRSDKQFVAITVSGSSGTPDAIVFPQRLSALTVPASFTNSGPVDEGSNVTVTFSGQGQPASGAYTYAYDWESDGIFDIVGSVDASASHVFDDNGSYTVTGRITAPDGSFDDLTTTVDVNNVAPTADVANNGPVDVNYPVTITVGQQHDPSTADTQAGFKYSYIWGDNTSDLGITAATKTHVYAQAATYNVMVRIEDKDGSFTDYPTTVVVNAPYYGYTVIAAAGPGLQLSSLGNAPSINDQGTVAFTAYFNNESGIFASDGTTGPNNLIDPNSVAWITKNDTLSTRDFGQAASINNQGDVAGREYIQPILDTYNVDGDYITLADPPQTIIRVWDKNGNEVDTLADVGGRRDSESLAAVIQGNPDVQSLLNYVDINDAGDVVYTFTDQYNYQSQYYQLYVGPSDQNSPQDDSLMTLPYGTFTRPLLDDDGDAVFQAGNSANSPIVLGAAGEVATVIASKSSPFYSPQFPDTQIVRSFTQLGRNPGVGSDGKVVAFMGGQIFNGQQQQGIYVSVPYGTDSRRIYQIVSQSDGPNGIPFSAIDPNDRVAVSKVDDAGGVTVAFVATDSTGHRGLYTVRVSGLDTGAIEVSRVIPVLRVGDSFAAPDASGHSTMQVVQNIAVNDPLNNDGQLAFWVSTATNQQFVLRATPPDIKTAPAQSMSSSEVDLGYQIDQQDVTHPFRIDLYGSADQQLSTTQDQHLGYVVVQNDQVESFDPLGNLVGVWSADTQSTSTTGIQTDASETLQSTSLWKQTQGAVQYIKAEVNTPLLSQDAYILTSINGDPKSAIAEGDYTNDTGTNRNMRIGDYLGMPNDGKLDFGPVISGESASTYVTIANYTTDSVEITNIQLANGQSVFTFPTMDMPSPISLPSTMGFLKPGF